MPTRPHPKLSPEAQQRLRRFADTMDSSIPIPGTKLTIGIDPLIGLIPAAGDAITMFMALYPIIEARRAGVGKWTLLRMGANVLFDALVGSIPVIGDAADFFLKANQRNLRLLGIEPTRRADAD